MNPTNESKIDVHVCRLTSTSSPLIELSLHPRQFHVFHSPKRFRVLVAGRRFGKTELALAELFRAAKNSPNRTVWYVAPSEKLAKRIVWHRLKKITHRLWAKKPSEQDLAIHLLNGSAIVVEGGFHPDSLRGEGLDFVVLDEAADLRPDAWTYSPPVRRPRLLHLPL